MKIIDRIFEYFDNKGIKPTAFEKKIGLSNGYLGKMKKRNADIGEGILIKIIENCPDLNLQWLILGKGNMLIDQKQNNITDNNKTPLAYNENILNIIAEKDKEIAKLNREIGGLEAELRILKKNLAQEQEDAGSVAATG